MLVSELLEHLSQFSPAAEVEVDFEGDPLFIDDVEEEEGIIYLVVSDEEDDDRGEESN